MVVIHDASCLLPVDYKLAKSYRYVVQALEFCISTRNLRHVIPSSSLLLLFCHSFPSQRLNCATIQDLCAVNASVAAAHDRHDLVHTWRTAALIADKRMGVPSEPDNGLPWAMHPFGRQLVHSL